MYEQETSFVQRGLDQNWTRQQFLEALAGTPNSGGISWDRNYVRRKPEPGQQTRRIVVGDSHSVGILKSQGRIDPTSQVTGRFLNRPTAFIGCG
jgi:hypothetical protein